MRKIYILLSMALTLVVTSCNDWLDVRPETETEEDDQFSSQSKFESALTGCYMSLASTDIYGTRLTMSNIESLAGLWYMTSEPSTDDRLEDYYLYQHDYDNEYAEDAIEAIYSNLFYVIVQANLIIKHGEENPDVFDSEADRSVIVGEAYAIRALCQLDVLRLFGQVPNGTQQVELPYSETTAYDEIPAYYTFDAYVAKLKSDLSMAENLLKDNDPLFTYSFRQLNYPSSNILDDDYFYYRQSRLNYWAVKALQARLYLYIGDTTSAYNAAMAVINATDSDGNAVMTLSGQTDLEVNGYKACPNECLFYLSKYDLLTVASCLIGGADTQCSSSYLYITLSRLNELFSDASSASNNRYWYVWNRTATDASNTVCATILKYYFSDDAENKTLYYQIIPMLRMSEMYLIAIETTTSLSEANELWSEYMLDHNVVISDAFSSLTEIQSTVLAEYRREFFAEGQTFYACKRLNQSYILWGGTMTEDDYILPLPDTEYNPNNL